jgi:hypothetical protein
VSYILWPAIPPTPPSKWLETSLVSFVSESSFDMVCGHASPFCGDSLIALACLRFSRLGKHIQFASLICTSNALQSVHPLPTAHALASTLYPRSCAHPLPTLLCSPTTCTRVVGWFAPHLLRCVQVRVPAHDARRSAPPQAMGLVRHTRSFVWSRCRLPRAPRQPVHVFVSLGCGPTTAPRRTRS